MALLFCGKSQQENENTYAVKNLEKNCDTSFVYQMFDHANLVTNYSIIIRIIEDKKGSLYRNSVHLFQTKRNILHGSKQFQNKFLFEIQHFYDHILSVYRDPILYI